MRKHQSPCRIILAAVLTMLGLLLVCGPALGQSGAGGKIAFASTRNGGFSNIYVMNADGTNQTRLTNSGTANDYMPAFNSDGSRILFVSGRDGNLEIYSMNADGTGMMSLTTPVAVRSAGGLTVMSSDSSPTWANGFVPEPPPAALASLVVSPLSLTSGETAHGTVSLDNPAPAGGALVSLASSNAAVASLPSEVTIQEGMSSATFDITTGAVSATTSVTLTASYAGGTQTATLTINPVPVPVLNSLSLGAQSVVGGNSLTGTVTLTVAAPAGGTQVTLSSSNGAVASLPASVTVAAGATSASFVVQTSGVTTQTSVSIGASAGGVSRTAALTVTPQPPPPPVDTVTVTRAEYTVSKKQLQVQAASTSATATLKAYETATGALIGTFKNDGGGKYSLQVSWPNYPQSVTVRSSQGGSATGQVKQK